MTRTQIYLSEELNRVLERRAKASGVTKSRLIRDAIERVYLSDPDAAATLRALETSAGAWRRRETGERYVERLRAGRLAQLHRPGEK
jgi:predicted transcriptional regulator